MPYRKLIVLGLVGVGGVVAFLVGKDKKPEAVEVGELGDAGVLDAPPVEKRPALDRCAGDGCNSFCGADGWCKRHRPGVDDA